MSAPAPSSWAAMYTFLQWLSCRSEEHTSELQSLRHLVCRLLLEKKYSNEYRMWIAHAPGKGPGIHIVAPSWTEEAEKTPPPAGVRGARAARATVAFFFFNDTATTEIYTLSLHDALPI